MRGGFQTLGERTKNLLGELLLVAPETVKGHIALATEIVEAMQLDDGRKVVPFQYGSLQRRRWGAIRTLLRLLGSESPALPRYLIEIWQVVHRRGLSGACLRLADEISRELDPGRSRRSGGRSMPRAAEEEGGSPRSGLRTVRGGDNPRSRAPIDPEAL